jgi:hypothetical protein
MCGLASDSLRSDLLLLTPSHRSGSRSACSGDRKRLLDRLTLPDELPLVWVLRAEIGRAETEPSMGEPEKEWRCGWAEAEWFELVERMEPCRGGTGMEREGEEDSREVGAGREGRRA